MLRSASQAVLIALAIAVGACGGGSDGKKDASGGTVVKRGELQRGGIVRMPSNEPKYLNPLLEPRFVVANALIFEGLVGLDATVEPVKRLAESWTTADEGRTITFKLRSDVKWHDGEPFTSADVLFTFEAIRGAAGAQSWKTYLSPVQSVTAPDEATVVVTYTEPDARALVAWTLPILPKHKFATGTAGEIDLTNAQANNSPVGTGPFKYARWEPGKRIYLEANKDWWHKQPHLDGVELVFGVTEAESLDALRRGQLDWTSVKDVDSWLRDAQTTEFRSQFEASEAVESRIRVIAWNTQRAPFDDKRVRKALTLGLDRGRVISDVLFGQAQPLSAPMFPNMFGYNAAASPAPFDPDKAKKLLDEAAPAGKDDKRFAIEVIAVDTLRGPATDAMAAIFRSDLANLGIDFKLTVLGSKEYYERIGRRDYDGVYFGWLPDIADPDPSALLDSSQAQSGANYAAFANPAVDKLLADARRTVDRDKRKKLYDDLQVLLADEEPYTPLYAPFGRYAWSRNVHGVTPRDVGPMAPLPGVAGWWMQHD